MSVASPLTGQTPRSLRKLFDANLEFTETNGDPIASTTTDGEDWAAPDFVSNIIDLGSGVVKGTVVLEDVTIDGTTGDEFAHIYIVGLDEAGTSQIDLGGLRLGQLALSAGTADAGLAAQDFAFRFENVQFNPATAVNSIVIWPKVRLEMVTGGTTAVVGIGKAYIVPDAA